MRFRDDRRNALLAPLALIIALAACGSGGKPPLASTAPSPLGPAADYPVVIGDPFTIDGVTYTPSDTLNVDLVGHAMADSGDGVSAAMRTLPLPSYAEVTSLESGRTILVRVERRGPMDNAHVIALSRLAMEQLDAQAGAPVRVRRVNPPEQERAALRRGEEAPLRMDTPMSLVEVLKRKLPESVNAPAPQLAAVEPEPAVAPLPAQKQAAIEKPEPEPKTASAPIPQTVAEAFKGIATFDPKPSAAAPGDTSPAVVATTDIAPAPIQTRPEPEPVEAETAAKDDPAPPRAVSGGYVVQAGAFSTEERATRVSTAIGGYVEKLRTLWRVRTGPYDTRDEAKASLAKVTGKGYSGARIYRTE